MTQVTDIRTLQEIDDEAATLRAALEDVERRLRGSEELNEARRTSAAVDSELADVRRAQRRIEGEVEGLTARIEPEEKRLYDGSVRNPKELQNIQHELDALKHQRTKLEDQLLEGGRLRQVGVLDESGKNLCVRTGHCPHSRLAIPYPINPIAII